MREGGQIGRWCAGLASAMSVCDWAGVGVHVRMRSTADDLCEENQ